jgi:hypothetical protein
MLARTSSRSSPGPRRRNESSTSVANDAAPGCDDFRWACSDAEAKSDFVISGAGRTLEDVLPPIVNGDPGDETAED